MTTDEGILAEKKRLSSRRSGVGKTKGGRGAKRATKGKALEDENSNTYAAGSRPDSHTAANDTQPGAVAVPGIQGPEEVTESFVESDDNDDLFLANAEVVDEESLKLKHQQELLDSMVRAEDAVILTDDDKSDSGGSNLRRNLLFGGTVLLLILVAVIVPTLILTNRNDSDAAVSTDPPTPSPTLQPVFAEFCADLTDLENYMKEQFEALFAVTLTTAYPCECSSETNGGNGTLTIDCSTTYNNIPGSEETFVNFEQAFFEFDEDSISLVQTAWGDTSYNAVGIFQETFFYDTVDEKLSLCRGNGCVSCGICPDGTSVEINCSNIFEVSYTWDCSAKYTGAFVNQYDFPFLLP